MQFRVKNEPTGQELHAEQSPARANTQAVGMNTIPVKFLEVLLQTKQTVEIEYI